MPGAEGGVPPRARGEVVAVVPAAGRGTRMGGLRKQLRSLGGAPLLVQTLRALLRRGHVHSVVVAGPPDDPEPMDRALRGYDLPQLQAVVPGGSTRRASVAAALEAVPPEASVVLVHDAVRPFVHPERVAAVVGAARTAGAASLAVPVADTLRRADPEGAERFGATVPRDGLFRVQTPQAFAPDVLRAAHAATPPDAPASDDAGMVQRLGHAVRLVPGDPLNVKITTPADWAYAQQLWPCWDPEDPQEPGA